MRKNFTKILRIPFVIVLVFFVVSAFSQTKHIVEASNNKFVPKELTIQAGDTVEWRNVQGNHNVNGNKSFYPSNPESFGNSLGFNWVYSYVFNTPGTYEYRCDPHIAFGMVGTIEVQTTTSIDDKFVAGTIKMYPNPAKEKVIIEYDNFSSPDVTVNFYDITGKKTFSEIYSSNNRFEINISRMVSGVYFVELSDATDRKMLKLIKE